MTMNRLYLAGTFSSNHHTKPAKRSGFSITDHLEQNMPPKNRLDGAAAVIEFMRKANLDVTTEQTQLARLIVSAKAGDKWRLNKEPLSVEFDGSNGVPDIVIPQILKPFYRTYRHIPGTRFMYDIIKDRLFIEGNLNKGRGDPFVICLSR